MRGISRRNFIKISAAGSVYSAIKLSGKDMNFEKTTNHVRLGGPVFKEDFSDPAEWVQLHKEWGYSAAYCPLKSDSPEDLVKAFLDEAAKSNLIIAEVGAWSNPISPDKDEAKNAFDLCCRQLDLADRIGANCCVNIAGSRNPDKWDGPHPDNLSQFTFDYIVEVTQNIIDTVKPVRTYFTLETMPWIFPNSVDSYLQLVEKINRKSFAIHFDPVNLINSPDKYYTNGEIIKDAFKRLGGLIKSCHGKDTILLNELTTHINETKPGNGYLDYGVYLTELSKLDNVPLMLEHMEEPEEYKDAIQYLRGVASENNLSFESI